MDRRDEVIDYVARTYGRDKVSRSSLRHNGGEKRPCAIAAACWAFPYGLVDGIAKLIPRRSAHCLSDALGTSEASRKIPN